MTSQKDQYLTKDQKKGCKQLLYLFEERTSNNHILSLCAFDVTTRPKINKNTTYIGMASSIYLRNNNTVVKQLPSPIWGFVG